MAELVARLRALIKRSTKGSKSIIEIGLIKFDTRTSTVTRDGQIVDLTTYEFRLLEILMRRAGDFVTRRELTEHLYAQDFERASNTIEVLIRRLRMKIGAHSIETVKGYGYRMSSNDTLIGTKS